MLAAILLHQFHIALDVVQALLEPGAAMAVGRLGGDDGNEVGVAQFINLNPLEERFPQLGVLDHAP